MALAVKTTDTQERSITDARSVPTMKMTTDIPASIATPDTVETRLGTLHFLDGFPDDATIAKVYDNLDFERGVQTIKYMPS
jgi:hypothetical protein